MAAVAIGASACAQEADPADVAIADVTYEATPEFVAAAAERSQAQPYRTEMRESLAGGEQVVVETGEWDGQRFYLRQDLGAPLAEMLPDAADVDLSIETAGDDSTLYLRMSKGLATGFGIVSFPPFGGLIDRLDGRWGRVDLDELADLLPGEQDTTRAIGTYDPRLFVEVVTKSKDVEELGEDEIRGVTVMGLTATVPLEDAINAQGAGPESLDVPGTIRVPIEVWVDRDGLVRRVGFDFGTQDLAEALGHEASPSALPVEVAVTVDLFDYGDGSIRVELPADAIDVTQVFREMVESMDGAPVPAGAT